MSFAKLTFCFLIATLAVSNAVAQTRITRPIHFIVPYVPGGGTDLLSRLLAPAIIEEFGQQVVVENRAGAGSTIGTLTVAKAAPDGHTIGMIDSAFITNPGLMAKLPYDTLKDFTPVVFVATAPLVLVVHPSVPAANLRELIALAKARPGQLAYASGGIGSGMHLAAEQLRAATGAEITHIPYKGIGQAVTDVLAGQAVIMFASPGGMRAHVASGKLRALAITGDRRADLMPAVPLFAESNLSAVDAISLNGIVAPAGTPAEYISRLNNAVQRALTTEPVQKRLAEMGFRASGGTPAEFDAYIQREVVKWAALIKSAGIRTE
jgi:tripartite-type tricarboxylate transporter receptor subunit TctC